MPHEEKEIVVVIPAIQATNTQAHTTTAQPSKPLKKPEIKCEHTLHITSEGAAIHGDPCGRTAICALCRSCGQHCYGHAQMRDGLRWRQQEYVESRGKSENG